jgi:hypothetical protein
VWYPFFGVVCHPFGLYTESDTTMELATCSITLMSLSVNLG